MNHYCMIKLRKEWGGRLLEVVKECTCWATWWMESMWHSKQRLKTGKSGRNCSELAVIPASQQITWRRILWNLSVPLILNQINWPLAGQTLYKESDLPVAFYFCNVYFASQYLCCVRFSLISTTLRNWLGRTSVKWWWYRVRRKT